MIYYFDTTAEELHDYIKNHGIKSVQHLLSKLIEADRAGNHFFMLPNRELIDWILANKDLNLMEIDSGHLQKIHDRYSTKQNMHEDAKTYLKIMLGDAGIKIESNQVFSIGHKTFLAGNYSRESYLVVENTKNDGKLYEYIFDEIIKIKKMPSLCFKLVPGDGTDTSVRFEEYINDSVVVTCIVDSDMESETDNLGKTAKPVMEIVKQRNKNKSSSPSPFVGDAIYTNCCTLENHIPYCIIENILDYENLERLNSAIDESKKSFDKKNWLYFKIKKAYGKRVIVKNLLDNNHELSNFKKFIHSSDWQSNFLKTFEGFIWFFVAPDKINV